MKTRLVILIAIALAAAACASSEATPNTGLIRTTSTAAPTPTTTASGIEDLSTSDGGTTTSVDGALPTNPGPVDAGPGDTEVTIPLEVEPCDPPTENLEPYCQPFELVLGNTRIVWDRWFWGQGTFSKGTVEVFHGDELVAAGPFVGEGSIVEQDDNDNFVFFDSSGTVVAIASPDDITPAIEAVLNELNG